MIEVSLMRDRLMVMSSPPLPHTTKLARDTARAMSRENVEAFKRAVEANNRNDYDALLEEIDPDVEWYGVMAVMFGGEATVFRGHAGLLEYLRDIDQGFTVRDIQSAGLSE